MMVRTTKYILASRTMSVLKEKRTQGVRVNKILDRAFKANKHGSMTIMTLRTAAKKGMHALNENTIRSPFFLPVHHP